MKLSLAYKLKKKDIAILIVMSVFLILLIFIKDFDYRPGITLDCDSCIQDIGTMERSGHYEEMLWNGVRHVHNSSNDNLIQFTKTNHLRFAQKEQTIENCIDCHVAIGGLIVGLLLVFIMTG